MMRPIVIFIVILIQFSCINRLEEVSDAENLNWNLLTKKDKFIAGENVALNFKVKGKASYRLLLSNAFGNSILTPKNKKDTLTFNIPENYSRKSGPCNWVFIASKLPQGIKPFGGANKKVLERGVIKILPETVSKATLETYFGPRSITAGVQDYSMLINVTTDRFDNVYPEGTEVLFKSQFLNIISEYDIPSKDLISWKNIYTTKKSGRILVNTSFKGITSKELTTNVFPTLPEDFTIEAISNHLFADGNQILKLHSNVIRDQYNNIISDGTMVNFVIENSSGAILKTSASTINGIAKATILHPSEKESWKIKAYVTGAAKSNQINLNFKTAITDYTVAFSGGNRILSIGPLKSFMGQLAPDGILTQLEIYTKDQSYLETKKLGSIKGYGIFELPKEYYPSGSYHLVCKAAGIIKKYDIELHEE